MRNNIRQEWLTRSNKSLMVGQSDRKDQPSIGHPWMVGKGDLDAIGIVG